MGHRRKAREYAIQALYIYELGNPSSQNLTDLAWVDKSIAHDIRLFAVSLISGTLEHINEIDALIIKYSRNWKFERISIVDKAILRICLFSLLYLEDIPAVVTIDEGIELGKIYGSETSGQFINGILDAVNKTEITRKE